MYISHSYQDHFDINFIKKIRKDAIFIIPKYKDKYLKEVAKTNRLKLDKEDYELQVKNSELLLGKIKFELKISEDEMKNFLVMGIINIKPARSVKKPGIISNIAAKVNTAPDMIS